VSSSPEKTDVTIVGGGFAGLAAALRLHRRGAKIRLLEKRAFFGGRAYSFREAKTGETVDNGQHLLMGCYHETFSFLKDLGTLDRLDIQKNLSVSFAEGPDKFFDLKCPNLPAPLHLALGLLRYRGLKWADKTPMRKLLKLSQDSQGNGHHLDSLSVVELLKQSGQTEAAILKFWEPLALATLNESLDIASAQLFVEVLRRSLLSKKSDSNLAISKVGLSELFATPMQDYLEDKGVPISFNSQVMAIERQGTGFLLRSNRGEEWASDKILFAVPPNALAKLLNESGPDLRGLVPNLDRFGSAPIVSINLWYEDFHPQQKMLGLIHSPIHWVFDKAQILLQEKPQHITLVVSGAHALATQKKEDLIALAQSELQRYYPELKSKPLKHAFVVKELEATFSARKGLSSYRPTAQTKMDGIFLAGDWTDTALPATIESAVLSGHLAADAILENRNAR